MAKLSEWTRNERGEYVLDADPRFRVVPEKKYGTVGVGGMVFGNYTYGDGSPTITGWHIKVDGSRKLFSPTRKLVDAKATVLRADWREWALSRVEAERAAVAS